MSTSMKPITTAAIVLHLTVLSFSFLMPIMASAQVSLTAPHNQSNGYSCSTCHIVHTSLAGSNAYNNTCLDCHRPGVPLGGNKPFVTADAADPFHQYTAHGPSVPYQTSHRWEGSDTVPASGAQAPLNSALNKPMMSGALYCVRCHNQHGDSSAAAPHLLRSANDQDQLCLDCHRSRDARSHLSGSHPVQVGYSTVAARRPATFRQTPLNANPANSSSDLNNYLKGGQVLCSTCHGVHYSDSNSATFDHATSYARLTPSDGYLLRTDLRGGTASAINICLNCHAGKINHNAQSQNVQCGDCHAAHVDYDPNALNDLERRPNAYLIRRYMNLSSPGKTIRSQRVFLQQTGANRRLYLAADGTGICQACHSVPQGSGLPDEHALPSAAATNCTPCHPHESANGAFSPSGGGCTACHGYPPTSSGRGGPDGSSRGYTRDEGASAHRTHASGNGNYDYPCATCHLGNDHMRGNFQDLYRDTTGSAAALSGAVPSYNGGSFTCSSVYCHSDGAPRNGSLTPGLTTRETPAWVGGNGAISGCSSCHAAGPATNAHARHSAVGLVCAICHNDTVDAAGAVISTDLHVNGTKDVTFAATVGTASWTASNAECSVLSCHNDGRGGIPNQTPRWHEPIPTDCTGCHGNDAASAMMITTGRHARHLNNYSTLGRGNNFGCVDCHAPAVTSNRTVFANGRHLNGHSDYSSARAGRISASTCANAYCHSTGMQQNQFWNMSAAHWTSSRTLGCTGCHGGLTLPDGTSAAFSSVAGEPNYPNGGPGTPMANSHQRHVTELSISHSTSCSICHRSTVDPVAPAKLRDYSTVHLSGTRNVAFTASVQGRYSSTTQQCVNLYCHSNGSPFDNSTTAYKVPAWGETLTCASCHADPAQADSLSGRHGKHTASTIYRSSCDRCHVNTVDSSGTIIDKTRHANRVKDISFREGGSYNSTTKRCTGTYCHSDGLGGAPTTTVKWSDTNNPMSCYSCHKGTPANSTEANCISILGNWSASQNACTPDLTMSSNGHHRLVGPQWVRKYPCYYCHTDTMNPDGTIKSAEKHLNNSRDVVMNSTWAIVGRGAPSYDPITKICSNVYCHSDGTTDPETVRPFAWTEPKTECNSCHGHPTGSCSNAGCHDGRTDAFGKKWTVMTGWPAGQEWMGAMPMFLSEGAGTARANSHVRHSQTNFSCANCHAATVLDGVCTDCHTGGVPLGGMGEVAHINASFHVNKSKDVVFKDGGSYNLISKVCSNTTCHSNGTDPVWGGSVNSAVTCLGCHGTNGSDQDDYNAFNGTQARINLTEWTIRGHGRYSTSGRYPSSNNPAANFPGNPCWYCHDNNVLHKDERNPYRLKLHQQYDRRFEKECVYCHMQGTDAECIACHVGQFESLAPQATGSGVVFKFQNSSTETRFPTHTQLTGCTAGGCHDSDSDIHNVNAGIWTADQKADVKNQYVMMGVCLQCHDDDTGGQCTSCHIAPPSNPNKYALGYDPGTGYIKPKQARASAGHFGYKHYRAFLASGGWTKVQASTRSPILGTYTAFQGTWKGGKFCWDCHDPHGDSNIYMIQKKVATTTDGFFGEPRSRAAVTFTSKLTGSDYARKSGPGVVFDGICNVCHSPASKHFTSNSGDGHNLTRGACTSCHEHRFADSHANKKSCNSCHENAKPVPKHTGFGLPRDCTKCHLGTVGKRMDVIGQMKSNSHHVQRTSGEIKNTDCYQCHWESTPDGLIDNQYHTGYNYKNYSSVKNDVVDLVLYGRGTRPAAYREYSTSDGRATATKFLAINMGTAGERNEVSKVSNHCISCHSDQNNDIIPFDDCKTPRQYAWDGQSIEARYAQTGTTAWGNYPGTATAAKKNFTKAFSAHGKAGANQGGWDNVNGLDGDLTGKNQRTGSKGVQCFDCHNSHGSKVVGTTSSYVTFNGTYNGANLKETKQNIGGYSYDYKASSNATGVNPYGAGAGQCFDCHNSATVGTVVPSGKTPWGYFSTYSSSAPVMGYRDTVRFGNGTKAFIAKNNANGWLDSRKTILGGHLKASTPGSSLAGLAKVEGTATGGSATTLADSGKSWTANQWRNLYVLITTGANSSQLSRITANDATTLTVEGFASEVVAGAGYKIVPYSAPINGLCTPCHDPHGVSPTLGTNQQYAVPLLKGTWMTSPYKEDLPPPDPTGTNITNGPDGNPRSWGKYRGHPSPTQPSTRYKLDRTTFGGTTRISENDDKFAGLCLNCHKKDTLTDGVNRNQNFRTVDRIHESVKGWGLNLEHSFTCSKCHQPHNSGLPRLMQTNCLDFKHRGNRASGGVWWAADSQHGNANSYGEHRGYPSASYYGSSWMDPIIEATASCHGSAPNNPGSYPDKNFWNDVTRW